MAKKIAKIDTVPPKTEITVAPTKKALFILLGLALIGIALVPSYYFYKQYQHSQKLLHNPAAAAKEEIDKLQKQVGKLINLPKEEPKIATITDKTKLKNHPFFAEAENGDKILIYVGKKTAILYRPSVNKIITVAPLTIEDNPQVAGATTQRQKTIKVVIYNGTTTTGLAAVYEKTLRDKDPNIVIVAKDNAAKKDYTQIVVVDLKGNDKTTADVLAKLVNGQVSSLPEGEKKPDADFLVIIGK